MYYCCYSLCDINSLCSTPRLFASVVFWRAWFVVLCHLNLHTGDRPSLDSGSTCGPGREHSFSLGSLGVGVGPQRVACSNKSRDEFGRSPSYFVRDEGSFVGKKNLQTRSCVCTKYSPHVSGSAENGVLIEQGKGRTVISHFMYNFETETRFLLRGTWK